MALARSARAKLAQVVVVFHQRNHALNEMQFFLFIHRIRLHALAAQQHVHPFLGCKRFPTGDDFIQIKIRQLDGFQAGDAEGRILRAALLLPALFVREGLFDIGIGYARDAPYAAHEYLAVLNRVFALNHKRLNLQICKARDIEILVFIQMGGHLVDDRILAPLTDHGFDLLALLRAHVILRKDPANLGDAIGNRRFVVRRTVHAQQILQHKGRHICAALEHRRQILPDDLPGEYIHNFPIQCVHVSSSSIFKSSPVLFDSRRRHFHMLRAFGLRARTLLCAPQNAPGDGAADRPQGVFGCPVAVRRVVFSRIIGFGDIRLPALVHDPFLMRFHSQSPPRIRSRFQTQYRSGRECAPVRTSRPHPEAPDRIPASGRSRSPAGGTARA